MSHKGFRYPYPLISKSQAEIGKEVNVVGNAYQNAGWMEVDFIPAEGLPTHIIFEWQLDGPPVYPCINL